MKFPRTIYLEMRTCYIIPLASPSAFLLFVHIYPTLFHLTLSRASQRKGKNFKISFRFAT